MPAGTVMGGSTGTNKSNKTTGQQPAALMPFIRASQLRREQPFLDVSKTITTSDQDLGTTPVPAYGFLRSIYIVVTTTATTTGTAPVYAEDAPFSVLKNIFLSEPNGAIIYQANNGFETYLHNKYGGYTFANDPASNQGLYTLVTSTTASFSFGLRIPVELRVRDGLGALPNQNAAATFMLRLTVASGAAAGSLYTTAPGTTQSTIRVQCFAEYWDQPPQTIDGVAAAQLPPAVATTQFWTTQQFTVNAGLNTIRLTRMGNYIRNLIFVLRRAGTSRANGEADWPDPGYLYVDIHQQDAVLKNAWIATVFERYGYGTGQFSGAVATAVGVGDHKTTVGIKDNGVYPYDFCHEFDGQVGMENNDLWLPTKASSRVEIQGTFTNAGVLTVLTNDIAVVGNVFM